MEKWNTIFKLKNETNSGADLFDECDWICTDFGFMIFPLRLYPAGLDVLYPL